MDGIRAWGIAMSIAGLIFGCLNYVTFLRTDNDTLYGWDRSGLTLLFVQLAFQAYLIVATCWYIVAFWG